jgi:hypothetical protein
MPPRLTQHEKGQEIEITSQSEESIHALTEKRQQKAQSE